MVLYFRGIMFYTGKDYILDKESLFYVRKCFILLIQDFIFNKTVVDFWHNRDSFYTRQNFILHRAGFYFQQDRG